MTPELASSISIFVLALLVGFEVISRIPTTLHTPMMSGANSIHGVVLVGAILVAGLANDPLGYVLAFLAAAFAAMNVVGGYVVTDRMLGMFRGRTSPSTDGASPSAEVSRAREESRRVDPAPADGDPKATRTPEAGRDAAATDGGKAVVADSADTSGAERGTSEADGRPSTSGAAASRPAVGPSRRRPDPNENENESDR
ncbi:proton-translocating transhydrogenase family protein [Luteimicrobium sp. DT211]|uniref:NAD(P) transhydrogenase subunit alpha n=1 Tax=Luteimicrobium sp. DT211 TaxID=3393412 RepID=UPI003CEC40A5